jgi:hypothetical protein
VSLFKITSLNCMLVQQIIIFVLANKLRRSNYGVNMEKHLMKKMLLKNQNKALLWLFSLASFQAALKVHNYCISNIPNFFTGTYLLQLCCSFSFFRFNPIPSLVHADNMWMIHHKMQCSLFFKFADFANSICQVHYQNVEVIGGVYFCSYTLS